MAVSVFDLNVTPYYKDPVQHDEDLKLLKEAAHFAYDKAGSWSTAVNMVLRSWAGNCNLFGSNDEGRFALVFIGQLFLEAYLKLRENHSLEPYTEGVFLPWVDGVFRYCAREQLYKDNNRTSWGLLGLALADKVFGISPTTWGKLARHMDRQWDAAGVMVQEVKRTNSGMWYSYFSLAPLLRACQVAEYPGIAELRKPLGWLFQYCVFPDKWPYKLPRGIWGKLWKWWYPCADWVEQPSKHDWPANLYVAAGKQFNHVVWQDWGEHPINYGVHIFREYCG